MRTTMDLSDEVMRRAKKRAADDGVALREIVERALRQFLEPRPKQSRYRLRWTPEAGRLRPGVDLDDRDSLFDIMDGLK
jgi:hypothetical protein